MNQGCFPIIFHQIMGMRKSSRKFLSITLCLITDKGDVKTHRDYSLTQGLPFYTYPAAKIGLVPYQNHIKPKYGPYMGQGPPPMLELDFGL